MGPTARDAPSKFCLGGELRPSGESPRSCSVPQHPPKPEGLGGALLEKMRKWTIRFDGRFRSCATSLVENRQSDPILPSLQLWSPVLEKQIAAPCRCFSVAAC